MSGDWQHVDYSLLGDEHVERYRATDGEVGYKWNGAPTLLLTTVGRKTGEPRTVPLIFARDGDRYVVVASVGGLPEHPDWYRNLQADPRATIQVKAAVVDVVARTARDAERSRLWATANGVWPNYETYQSRTDRVIPIVVLSPRSAGS